MTKAKRVNEKLAAVQPPKEEPDDSPDSQARKARKLRLTKYVEITTKQSNCALS